MQNTLMTQIFCHTPTISHPLPPLYSPFPFELRYILFFIAIILFPYWHIDLIFVQFNQSSKNVSIVGQWSITICFELSFSLNGNSEEVTSGKAFIKPTGIPYRIVNGEYIYSFWEGFRVNTMNTEQSERERAIVQSATSSRANKSLAGEVAD